MRLVPLCLLLAITVYAQPKWKVLYDSGNLFLEKDAARAVQLFTKAELIARNDLGIYHDNYIVIVNGLGLAQQHTGKFDLAQKYLLQTVSLGREVYSAEDPRMLQSLYNLGVLYGKTGEFDKSSDLFNNILDAANKTSQRTYYALAATQLVNTFERKNDLDSALILVRSTMASPLMKDKESSSYELRLAEGRILRKMRKYSEAHKALATLNKQLVARGTAFRPLAHSTSIQLALLDTDMGLYSKAEKDLLQLYRQTKGETTDNTSLLIEVTNSIAFVYEKLGVYDKALAYYDESLTICTSVAENSRRCDAIQNNIAGIFLKQKQFDKAISGYSAYIDSRKDDNRFDDPDFLAALNNLATALRQTDQNEKALEYLNSIYHALKAANRANEDVAATVLNNIAVTQTMSGNYVEAAQNFEQALKIKESFYGNDSPLLVDICGNLAVALWASGKRADALPYFERSLRLGLREVQYNFPNLTESEQVQFYAQQKENFERFNTLAVESSKETPALIRQMFNNQVFLKSLTFFTNRKTSTLAKDVTDPKIKNAFELKQSKSAQLGHYYQTPLKELAEQKISLAKLENEIDSLDKIIRHTLALDGDSDIPAWEHVQLSLAPNEASIDVIRFRKYDILPNKNTTKVKIGFTDSVYYAVIITKPETKQNPELVLLKNGRELESRFFAYYKNAIRFDVDDTISIKQYWAPIEKQLTGKKTIYFSPDGIFRQINLNTLRGNTGIYNIEKFDIHLSLNPAGIIKRKLAKPVNLSKLALIGDPVFGLQQASVGYNSIQSSFTSLPGTQQEVNEIAKIVKSTSAPTLYLREQASEQNLRKLQSPGVLHIATHGFFSIDVSYLNEQVKSDYLFHSGILLSAGKAENNATANDGIVTSYDILDLDLRNTDLVVLSACETGLGKNEYGEGIHGLQRSFMQAGAKEIVISLWRVDDRATKDLMIKFYQYLQQKKSVNEALRLAQIDLMKKEPVRRLWGSFITVGSY